jgi:hypothetical protein
MPPRSILHMLWRLWFPRRNMLHEDAGRIEPDPLAEARRIRAESEAKLARTDKVLADTRTDLWLLHQRDERSGNGRHQ